MANSPSLKRAREDEPAGSPETSPTPKRTRKISEAENDIHVPLVKVKPQPDPAPIFVDWKPHWTSPKKGRSISNKDFATLLLEGAEGLHTPPDSEGYRFIKGLWFADGDLMVTCGDILFRVHKAKLVESGEMFSEMFEFPQPEDAPSILGHEICDMSGDSSRDVAYLFGHIYGLIVLPESYTTMKINLFWDAFQSLLKMADKYGLGALRKQCTELMSQIFPWELKVLRSLKRSESDVKWATGVGTNDPWSKMPWVKIFLIQAINLIRLYNIPRAMPFAYYRCAGELEVADIITGVRDLEGNVVAFDNPLDVVRIISGREQLFLLRRQTLFQSLQWMPYSGEEDQVLKLGRYTDSLAKDYCCDECRPWFKDLSADFMHTGFMECNPMALGELSQKTKDSVTSRMCSVCGDHWLNKMARGIEKGFLLLPKFFGWESWYEVLQAQEKEDEHWRVACGGTEGPKIDPGHFKRLGRE